MSLPMLVLTRKTNQSILIPDLGIIIRVLEIRGCRVRLGIEAPSSVKVLRGELQADANVGCGPRSSTGAENLAFSGDTHPKHRPAG